jgi:hypothetical protein
MLRQGAYIINASQELAFHKLGIGLTSSIQASILSLFVFLVLYLPDKQHGVCIERFCKETRPELARRRPRIYVILFLVLFFVQPHVRFQKSDGFILFVIILNFRVLISFSKVKTKESRRHFN